MTVDTLSDVLHRVRLTGTLFFDVDVHAPWVAEAPPSSVIAAHVLPGAEHVIEFHAVLEGSCYGGSVHELPIRLEAGDVIAFPLGDGNVMSSEPGMRDNPDLGTYRQFDRDQLPLPVRTERSDAPRTHMLCGFVGFDTRPFNPLLATLPSVMVIHGNDVNDTSLLPQLLQFMRKEAEIKRSGGEASLARLSELMFVELLRHYTAGLPHNATGWLAALRDGSCGRALGLMHASPGEAWSVDALSREVNLTQAAFAERFEHLVGVAPMRYLVDWRMQVAAGLLIEGRKQLAEIGTEVGYESEAAFSRAFKRVVGEAPFKWRRGTPHRVARHDGARHDDGLPSGTDADFARLEGARNDGDAA